MFDHRTYISKIKPRKTNVTALSVDSKIQSAQLTGKQEIRLKNTWQV